MTLATIRGRHFFMHVSHGFRRNSFLVAYQTDPENLTRNPQRAEWGFDSSKGATVSKACIFHQSFFCT
jgi:DNA/RNA endonuclease G (NUC1)